MKMQRSQRLISSFIIIGLALSVYAFYPKGLSNQIEEKLVLSGYQTSFMVGDYEMEDHHGNSISWSQLSERPVYLTAGFTRCPHACPMTMVIYQKMAKKIGAQAVYALLTVDPEYDQTATMKAYLNAINHTFLGLRIGNKRELDLALADLKQTLVHTKEPLDLMHSNHIYLIHPKLPGIVIYTKPNVDAMAKDLTLINAT